MRYGNAAWSPSRRVILVMPPAPGMSPSVTSGKPSWIFESSTQMRQCAASAISNPPPSAVSAITATTGLPSFSSRRKSALTASMPSNIFGASTAVSFTTSFNSAPAKKVFLAEARITPSKFSFSFSSRVMFSVNAAFQAADMVLTEPSGASNVSVTTRSAPSS